MAQYSVTSPDGTKFNVTAPDGASNDDVMNYAKGQFAQMQSQQQSQLQDAVKRDTAAAPTSQTQGFMEGLTRPAANIDRASGALIKNLTGYDDGSAQRYAKWQHNFGLDVGPNAAPISKPGAVGNVAGEVVGTAPATALLGPLAGGASFGALTSDANDAGGALKDAALGAAGGKLTDLGLGAAGKVIAPKISPYAQALLQKGVPLSIGQMLGGTAKSIEDKVASTVPFVGDLIKNAQGNATRGMNKVALNDALSHISQQLPAGMDAGRAALDHTGQAFSDTYDALLPNMTGTWTDPGLQKGISQIGTDALHAGAKQDTIDRFLNVMKGQIGERADVNGNLTGQALKQAQSNLGSIGRGYISSSDADTRQLGSMILDGQQSFNKMLENQNPGFGDALSQTNKGFAKWATVAKAGGSLGAKDGVFSAPQFASAVKASDSSAGKRAYARGNAMMQGLSDPANSVLPSSVGDSGTTGRALMGALLLNGPGFAGAALAHPATLAPGLLAAGLYSKAGQAGLRAMYSAAPAQRAAIRGILEAARSPGAIAGQTLPGILGIGSNPATN